MQLYQAIFWGSAFLRQYHQAGHAFSLPRALRGRGGLHWIASTCIMAGDDRTDFGANTDTDNNFENTVMNETIHQARSEFEQKLQYNLDRFTKILLDEEESKNQLETPGKPNPLLSWLKVQYGNKKIDRLMAENMQAISPNDQRAYLQDFLNWFRAEFPYYHDQCDHCQNEGCSFQGNEPPNEEEQSYSKYIDATEVYMCNVCHKTTRFPRYLAAAETLRRRKGRCSEYSILLYRILRILGHKSRWIVDWANHVWVEVWMEGRWVHLDPCEASIDEPLLYQRWGKTQTFIIAFEAPLKLRDHRKATSVSHRV